MRSFQVSKDSSFRILCPSNKIEIEEETVETNIQLQVKNIYRPIKIILPPPNLPKIITSTKSCNCKKSQCLKQYCDCFANGQVCSENCNCVGCFNNSLNNSQRKEAKLQIKARDPGAFKQAFKGCNCKKSGCQKKYCECFQNNLQCTHQCRCEGCVNCLK
ncbi:unnamed protein product [Paramecium primaurelia]|uniref:CRC domain-containing protein n=1 Tax=Paramecium primaurelia TaxID=5886 RepID=A0A8S1LS39_PARPR|nr:unnamed protein product [Paramecium primaurelia]